MDSILAALEVNVEKLYKEKKFHEVEEMFSTFLKESQNEPAPIKARALNNRGHAKYMQVEFDAALQDYNEGMYTNTMNHESNFCFVFHSYKIVSQNLTAWVLTLVK